MKLCAYLIRGERGRVECSQPATHKNFTGAKYMHLCADHAVQVQRATHGRCVPEPLGEADHLQGRDGALRRPDEQGTASTFPAPVAETQDPAITHHAAPDDTARGFREQLRRWRAQQEARGDNATDH